MGGEVEFIRTLSEEGLDRIRVIAEKEKGVILSFVVQYEALINNKWREIIRYDTRHGFAHKDVIHPNGKKDKQPLFIQDYNAAFTFAMDDLKTSWAWYRRGYEMELGL